MSTSNSLKQNILRTLKYKDLFGQGLSIIQISYFNEEKIDSYSLLCLCLEELLSEKKIYFFEDKYSLRELDRSQYDEFTDKRKTSMTRFLEIEFFIKLISKISFIKMIGVTGSLASYHYENEEDVDLFFVTEARRVWLTRLIVVLVMKIFRVYVHQNNAKIKFCPNLYISEISLEWSSEKRNIYIAHEILMLQPIYNKNECYQRFLYANRWVMDFFPNFTIYNFDNNYVKSENFFLDWFDNFSQKVQTIFMKKPTHLEELSSDKIHFLVSDHSEKILKNFKS
jgi:hypothetical protein